MGLLVISFAATGMSGFFTGPSANTLVTVGKTVITPEEFRSAFTSAIQQESQKRNQQISLAQARQLGLDQQTLSQLMTEAVLTESARRMGLEVTDETVAQNILGIASFKDSNGQFSRDRFNRFLQSANLTEQQVIEQQRDFLLRQQLVQAIVFEKPAPQPLIEAVFAFQNESRSVRFVKITDAMLGEIQAPEDAVLEEFFNSRKTQFVLPQLRSFVALHLDRETLQKGISLSEEELRAAYDTAIAGYTTPEKRFVERIPFKNLEDAKAAAQALEDGKTFDALAEERGVSKNDLSLGLVTQNGIVDAKLGAAAFSLPLNGVSGAVEGQFAAAIIRVTAIEPETSRSFEDVKEELRQQLLSQRISGRLSQLYAEIDKQRAAGATLKEITESLDLPLLTFTKVAENGTNQEGQAVAGIPDPERVMPAVFDSDVDVENDAIQIAANDYFWFEVTAVEETRERTFAEAKSRATTAWMEQEKNKRLDEKTADTVKKLREGAAFSNALAPLTAEPTLIENITRVTGNADLGNAAVSALFATPVEGFASAQGSQPFEKIIFQVTARTVPAFNAEALGPLAQQLAQSYESDVLDLYLEQQRLLLNPQINPQVLVPLLGTELR